MRELLMTRRTAPDSIYPWQGRDNAREPDGDRRLPWSREVTPVRLLTGRVRMVPDVRQLFLRMVAAFTGEGRVGEHDLLRQNESTARAPAAPGMGERLTGSPRSSFGQDLLRENRRARLR